MPRTFEIVHTCVFIHNTNAHGELSDSLKDITFVSHFFLHIYDCLSIPCWQSYLLYANVYKTFTVIQKYFNLQAIFVLSYLRPLMYSLFGRLISFPLFMLITFQSIHTCVSILTTNAYSMLSYSHKHIHLLTIFSSPNIKLLHLAYSFCTKIVINVI